MSIDRIPLPDSGMGWGTSGGLWLTSLRDVAPDPDAALAVVGAGTVVCLNMRAELERRAPHYIDWLTAHQPGRALWFPVRDFAAESADATLPFVEMIVERLGHGVVMHCALGQGRAGTMAVAVLLALGMGLDEACRAVAGHRAGAGPASPSQWALVEDIAAHLRQ